MSTSLVVIDTETSAFKYTVAMCFFRSDMYVIDAGMASSITYDSRVMNQYIDAAISLLH